MWGTCVCASLGLFVLPGQNDPLHFSIGFACKTVCIVYFFPHLLLSCFTHFVLVNCSCIVVEFWVVCVFWHVHTYTRVRHTCSMHACTYVYCCVSGAVRRAICCKRVPYAWNEWDAITLLYSICIVSLTHCSSLYMWDFALFYASLLVYIQCLFIRLNKREIPRAFASSKEAKKRAANSSIFCFSKSCELVSYTARSKKKNVCLLSTAHATEALNEETGKQMVIHDYNSQKGGVDTLDKMLRGFTCKRKIKRWPMIIFYNMIDVAALAALRMFEVCHPAWRPHKMQRRKLFLKDLAMDLAQNHMRDRCSVPIRAPVKSAMDLIGFKPEAVTLMRQMPEVQVNNWTFDFLWIIVSLGIISFR